MRGASGSLLAVGATSSNACLGWMPAKQARFVVSGGDVGAGSRPCASHWSYGFSALAPVDGMSALWRTARM